MLCSAGPANRRDAAELRDSPAAGGMGPAVSRAGLGPGREARPAARQRPRRLPRLPAHLHRALRRTGERCLGRLQVSLSTRRFCFEFHRCKILARSVMMKLTRLKDVCGARILIAARTRCRGCNN